MKLLLNLLEIKKRDRCLFETKADSATMLSNQLTSTAPKRFSCNNIHGSESDCTAEIEDEGADIEINSIIKDY